MPALGLWAQSLYVLSYKGERTAVCPAHKLRTSLFEKNLRGKGGEDFKAEGRNCMQSLEGSPYPPLLGRAGVMGRQDTTGHCGLRPQSSSRKLSEC